MTNYGTTTRSNAATFANMARVQDVVVQMVHCEICAYASGDLGPVFSLGELVRHMATKHWTRVGSKNGHSIYACQWCESNVLVSRSPVIDFAGNLMCDVSCLRQSLRTRIQAGNDLTLQRIQDEAYVRESLGVDG